MLSNIYRCGLGKFPLLIDCIDFVIKKIPLLNKMLGNLGGEMKYVLVIGL